MVKSSDKDLYAKKRWVSVNPFTRELLWAKSETSVEASKSIYLDSEVNVSLVSQNNSGLGCLRVVPAGGGESVTLELPMEVALTYKKIISLVCSE